MRDQVLNSAAASISSHMGTSNSQQWEYKTVVLPAKKMNDPKYVEPLNEFGRQGWELVSTSGGNAVVSEMIYFFKRPLHRQAHVPAP